MDTRKDIAPGTTIGAAKVVPGSPKRIFPLVLAALAVGIILAAAIGFTRSNQSQAARPVTHSNALEMQYARPRLEVQDANALEQQDAQRWLDLKNKYAIENGNAIALQYARPWMDAQKEPSVQYGNALELLYARPWLDKQEQLDCISRLNLLYACRNGLNPKR